MCRRRYDVGHFNFPDIGITDIDPYCRVTPLSDSLFRDRTYFAADWIRLNKLNSMVVHTRREVDRIPFLNSLLAENRATFRFPPKHLNRV